MTDEVYVMRLEAWIEALKREIDALKEVVKYYRDGVEAARRMRRGR
jgi:exonuclease VII small subunit